MNILITGATGFLGRTLLRSLIGENHCITVITRASSDLTEIVNLPIKIISLDADCVDKKFEHELIKCLPCDLIIHCATDYCKKDDTNPPIFANTLLPTFLLKFCLKHKINIFLNFDTFFNCKRASPYDYLREYVLTKKYFYEYAKLLLTKSSNLIFLNLKIFHMYGQGDRMDKFIPEMVRKCSVGEAIDLTSGIQKRDFVYVDDVVSACKVLLNANLNPGFYDFDLGSGELTSIKKLVTMINRLCGKKSKLNFGAIETRSGEIKGVKADTRPLKELGWQPQITIEAGLSKLTKNKN